MSPLSLVVAKPAANQLSNYVLLPPPIGVDSNSSEQILIHVQTLDGKSTYLTAKMIKNTSSSPSSSLSDRKTNDSLIYMNRIHRDWIHASIGQSITVEYPSLNIIPTASKISIIVLYRNKDLVPDHMDKCIVEQTIIAAIQSILPNGFIVSRGMKLIPPSLPPIIAKYIELPPFIPIMAVTANNSQLKNTGIIIDNTRLDIQCRPFVAGKPIMSSKAFRLHDFVVPDGREGNSNE